MYFCLKKLYLMCIIVSWKHLQLFYLQNIYQRCKMYPLPIYAHYCGRCRKLWITFHPLIGNTGECEVRRGYTLARPPPATPSSSKVPLAKDGVTYPNNTHQPGTECSNAYGDILIQTIVHCENRISDNGIGTWQLVFYHSY